MSSLGLSVFIGMTAVDEVIDVVEHVFWAHEGFFVGELIVVGEVDWKFVSVH